MGSLSREVTERGIARLGEEVWAQHRETVAGFWRSVWEFFDGIDVTGMNVYQDGMMADGHIGRSIVEDTARAGSLNYQLVLKLLDRGALLVKTEDLDLVKQEYDRLTAMTRAKSMRSKLMAVAKYKLTKTSLLAKRDAFIAARIDETLQTGQTGILFIGALHEVRVAADIRLEEIKDRQKVREYQNLLPFHSRHPLEFEALGKYLTARVVPWSP
ncbi:MAG: hypothetical protein A2Y76_13475 [Planctomycetes bacterium RBG_13_60_9]|nr:MAG: hypothetical protein A2Y76_13475 [Planctomycetes bacterium RBG_13_60_9]